MSTQNSEKNSGNVSNLVPHQFRKGQSGNPGGRPKTLPITDHLINQLGKPIPASMRAKLSPIFTELYGDDATFAEMLAFRLIADAANGDVKALKLVLDRVEGKVAQKMALSGAEAEPVMFTLVRMGVEASSS